MKKFSSEWEDESGGSKDPRFQCYLYPYEAWYQKHGQWIPTLGKPTGPGKAVWWYTPSGFVYHQLSKSEEFALGEEYRTKRHPASQHDIWMHAIELWPEKFGDLNIEALTYGYIYWSERAHCWLGVKVAPVRWNTQEEFPAPTPQEIRDWFNMPADSPIEDDDF